MLNKKLAVVLALGLCFGLGLVGPLAAADQIFGMWTQISDATGKPESVVLIYTYGGKLYGRMMATFDDKGSIKETIYTAKTRADKLVGNPLYAGIDYIYHLVDTGREWSGLIMDPRTGDEYDCRIWKEGSKLVVRGQLKGLLGFLGRNQTWVPLASGLLPADFKQPDVRSFVPVIPRKK